MICKQKRGLLILALILILMGQPTQAAQPDSILKVGISPFSPFVILSSNEPAGLSIEMWQAIALQIDREFEYVACKGVGDKLKRLQNGSIDIAIGGITITEEREALFDFTSRLLILPNSVTTASCIPADKYSSSGSHLLFETGMTATEGPAKAGCTMLS